MDEPLVERRAPDGNAGDGEEPAREPPEPEPPPAPGESALADAWWAS
jgi:hypothetical protein